MTDDSRSDISSLFQPAIDFISRLSPWIACHAHYDTGISYVVIERSIENGGRVLVHCEQGMSRSATIGTITPASAVTTHQYEFLLSAVIFIVIAYLMATNGWPLAESFHFVKAARSVVQVIILPLHSAHPALYMSVSCDSVYFG
jgi:hypothetical protein